MDPAIGCRPTEVLETKKYVIDQPICIISTKYFLDFTEFADGNRLGDIINEFYKITCEHKTDNINYNIVLNDSGHLNQIDVAVQIPEAFAGANLIGEVDAVREKYHQNAETVLAYLDEHDFLPKPFGKKVEDISGIEILTVQSS